MQYIPPGFWPRLITRLLDDEKLCTIFSKIFLITWLGISKSPNNKTEEVKMDTSTTSLTEPFNLGEFNQMMNNFNCWNKFENLLEKETIINSPTSFKPSNKCCKKEQFSNEKNNFSEELDSSTTNDSNGGFEWLLWQTGIEVSIFTIFFKIYLQFLVEIIWNVFIFFKTIFVLGKCFGRKLFDSGFDETL